MKMLEFRGFEKLNWEYLSFGDCFFVSSNYNFLLGVSVVFALIIAHFWFSGGNQAWENVKDDICIFPNLGIQNKQTFIPIETIEDAVIVEHIPNLWRVDFLLIVKCKLLQSKNTNCELASDDKSDRGTTSHSKDALKTVIVPLLQTDGESVRLKDLQSLYQQIQETFSLPSVVK